MKKFKISLPPHISGKSVEKLEESLNELGVFNYIEDHPETKEKKIVLEVPDNKTEGQIMMLGVITGRAICTVMISQLFEK
jgi:hypothetical protein